MNQTAYQDTSLPDTDLAFRPHLCLFLQEQRLVVFFFLILPSLLQRGKKITYSVKFVLVFWHFFPPSQFLRHGSDECVSLLPIHTSNPPYTPFIYLYSPITKKKKKSRYHYFNNNNNIRTSGAATTLRGERNKHSATVGIGFRGYCEGVVWLEEAARGWKDDGGR